MPAQLRFKTGLTGEQYVTREFRRKARLERCPLHVAGGCGFARHGTYQRKNLRGRHGARWYCPRGHRTFSLLPDHLAARFPGALSPMIAALRQRLGVDFALVALLDLLSEHMVYEDPRKTSLAFC